MRDVADAGKSFAPEAVGANRGKVLKGFELRCGESLAENAKVVFLFLPSDSRPRRVAAKWANIDAMTIVGNLKKL